jgi:hypothetical protein
LLRFASQFFQIIFAALFVPNSIVLKEINPQKLGQKSTATQKVKHGIYRKKQNSKPARHQIGRAHV